MLNDLLDPPTLIGAESTAKTLKAWLVEDKGTCSGLLGVNSALQVISVRSFEHELRQPSLRHALSEAVHASASGVVAYAVSDFFDQGVICKLANACELLNVTLLDVIIFSPRGWQSARQQNLL